MISSKLRLILRASRKFYQIITFKIAAVRKHLLLICGNTAFVYARTEAERIFFYSSARKRLPGGLSPDFTKPV